jgi:uncharacterized protein (UPF0332 family)
MDFDWVCCLSLAEEMRDAAEKLQNDAEQQCLREAYLRSAISRFYYGVFCVARNLLDEYIDDAPEEYTHKFVRCEYLKAEDKEVKKVGRYLDRLWGKRRQADYDDEIISKGKILDVNDIAEEAKTANKEARNSIQQIRQLKFIAMLSSSFNTERCEKYLAKFPVQTSLE